jgi:membrane-bound lytic murein transglycosylase A
VASTSDTPSLQNTQQVLRSQAPSAYALSQRSVQPAVLENLRERGVPVAWEELPGWSEESLSQVWTALALNCQQNSTALFDLCPLIKPMVLADEQDQRFFLMSHFQPFRLSGLNGEQSGLLTGYYEPVLNASRIKKPGFEIPLYAPTDEILALKSNHTRWYSRQDIDSLEAAQKALRGREIAWLADPIDVLVLQIQGSGRLALAEADGSQRMIKVVYAASNEQPYQSVGKYLLEKNEITDASWSGIKAWVSKNPGRLKELLWSNPRYVFFKEEVITDGSLGPKGAMGIPLTAGRSVAVDPSYIPYGTLLWAQSEGPSYQLKKMVIAQDTGGAILGPLRADFYLGTGIEAGEIAGRLKQTLNLWALLPR